MFAIFATMNMFLGSSTCKPPSLDELDDKYYLFADVRPSRDDDDKASLSSDAIDLASGAAPPVPEIMRSQRQPSCQRPDRA